METIISLLILGALAVAVWIWDKKTNGGTARPVIVDTNKKQYAEDPGYRWSKNMLENVIDGAALVEQHANGYHLHINKVVYVNSKYLGDFEVGNHARWIDEHGANNGVEIHVMDGDIELTGYDRHEALYGERNDYQ